MGGGSEQVSASTLDTVAIGSGIVRRVAQLPAPHRRAGEASPSCQPLPGRQQDDGRPLHMLLRAVSVAEDRRQARAILRSNDDTDSLGQAASFARQPPTVNLSVCVSALVARHSGFDGFR